jgi:hypothetical protein
MPGYWPGHGTPDGNRRMGMIPDPPQIGDGGGDGPAIPGKSGIGDGEGPPIPGKSGIGDGDDPRL